MRFPGSRHIATGLAAAFILSAVCIVVLAVSVPTYAQGVGVAVSHFDDGNRRYRQGDYRGAIDSYERALEQGYASDALYFNMGNAYFRLDEIGQAIRFYEKARRIGSDSAELRHNLSIARERTVDDFSRLPEPFWMPFWDALVDTLRPVGLFSVGLAFYILAFGALMLRIRDGQTSWRRRAATFGLVLAFLFVTSGFVSSAQQLRARTAVVLSESTPLVESPQDATTKIDVHEGLVVEVVSNSGLWTQVRLPNGTEGWLRAEDLGEI